MQNELYHWGIKGQRWGVRRYQNDDGSLTEEGKLRYAQSEARKARFMAKVDVANQRNRFASGVGQTLSGGGMTAIGAYMMLKKYPDKVLDNGKQKTTGGLKKVGGALIAAIGVGRLARGLSNIAYNPEDKTNAYLAEQRSRKLNVSGMSDEELLSATNRNILETNYYRSLNQTADVGRQQVKSGIEKYGDAIKVVSGIGTAIGVATSAVKLRNTIKGKDTGDKKDKKEDD